MNIRPSLTMRALYISCFSGFWAVISREFFEPTWHFQANHTEYSLAEYAAWHLACAEHTVDEYDWHFLDFETALVGGKLHLYLECVAFEADVVERKRGKHTAGVAYESGGGVTYRHARDDAYIGRCIIWHQHTSHRPVDHVDACKIAWPNGHVGSLFGTRLI